MASLERAPGDSGKEKKHFFNRKCVHSCGTAVYTLLGWEWLVPGRCLHQFQLPGGGPPPAYSPAQPEMEVGAPEGPAQLKMEVEEAAAGRADGPQTHLVTSAV